jgi:hypothetical protein
MPETTALENVKSKGFARTTNDALSLPHVDGRSPWARRRRDLIRQFTKELGGTPTLRQRVLVSNVSAAIVASEQMQSRIVSGDGTVAPDDIVRVGGLVARLLAALSDTAPEKPSGSALLREYLEGRTDITKRPDKRTGDRI